MWKASSTESVIASAEAGWKRWAEVNKWPEQDDTLISAAIDGPFKVGSAIILRPKGSPKVKVVLSQVIPNRSFVSEGKLPLAKIRFEHRLETADGQTRFTQSITMAEPLSGLFSKLMGRKMRQNLKARMSKMAELIEQDQF